MKQSPTITKPIIRRSNKLRKITADISFTSITVGTVRRLFMSLLVSRLLFVEWNPEASGKI